MLPLGIEHRLAPKVLLLPTELSPDGLNLFLTRKCISRTTNLTYERSSDWPLVMWRNQMQNNNEHTWLLKAKSFEHIHFPSLRCSHSMGHRHRKGTTVMGRDMLCIKVRPRPNATRSTWTSNILRFFDNLFVFVVCYQIFSAENATRFFGKIQENDAKCEPYKHFRVHTHKRPIKCSMRVMGGSIFCCFKYSFQLTISYRHILLHNFSCKRTNISNVFWKVIV